MSNSDINVDRWTDRQTDGKADAYVTKSGGQGMFHARFDGCLVLLIL